MRRSASRPIAGRHRRHGFTLVEMLVVITIIAVLVGLLLPAIQGVREAGRRTVCQNNLYQAAFAAIRHDEQNGFIPGWRNTPSGTTGAAVFWVVPLFPFMERRDIFNAYMSGGGTAFVQSLVCPSSPPDAQTSPFVSYAGSVGTGAAAARGVAVMVDTTVMASRVTMDDVSANDGTATTMILSEKCGPFIGTSVLWTATPPQTNFTPIAPVSRALPFPVFGIQGTNPTRIINSGTAEASGVHPANAPSSQHPGGAVVAFCDGHTQFLKDSLQRQVYGQLSSWNHPSATADSGYASWVGAYLLSEADY